MLKKCFGIISWLPNDQKDRLLRKKRLINTLDQLNKLFPNIDILIIAQNWKRINLPEYSNNIIIKKYNKLGITGARIKLREEFLKLGYDYLLFADDDLLINYSEEALIDYLNRIDLHKSGFCYLEGNKTNPYCNHICAPLNLCAISKDILEKEPMIDIDPMKYEGFEDSIYITLLHYKYPDKEFSIPSNISCTQANDTSIPSTWNKENKSLKKMFENTYLIEDYISKYKDRPNIKLFLETGTLQSEIEDINTEVTKKRIENQKIKNKQKETYLYF